MKRNTIILVSFGIIIALAAAVISNPGRAGLSRVVGVIGSKTPPPHKASARSGALTPSGTDVGQQAAAAAGWTANIHNSVTTGNIARYDRTGAATSQAGITIYMKYPDSLRVDIDHGGGNHDIIGFDQGSPWSSAKSSLSATDSRDIRAWLRTRPERLFAKRGGGAGYREAGQVTVDHISAMPWQPTKDLDPSAALKLDQVEIIDDMNPTQAPGKQGPWSDRRRNYYYVNTIGWLIASERWMEPDDPTQDPDSLKVSKTAVEIDYGNYQQSSGVQWPFDIVHWYGGKVDYRIVVSGVKVNQPLEDTLFQKP
jgi:hypothetical protein